MTWPAILEIHNLVSLFCTDVVNTCMIELGWNVIFSSFDVCSATIFNNANQQINVYGDDVEVDYRGYEVSQV